MKIQICQAEYDDLCSFRCDRSTAQFTMDVYLLSDASALTAIGLGEQWEENRHAVMDNQAFAQRRELVDQVYEVAKDDAS